METIRNYLDTMFANLPNTAASRKAKGELLQMMEDKYNELMDAGKSENKAVGTVIAEFGNLSELAEVLGVEDEINTAAETVESAVSARILTVQETESYAKARSEAALRLSLGCATGILALLFPILFEVFLPHLEFVGVLLFLLLSAAGVVSIVMAPTIMKPFLYIKNEVCTLSMDATKQVANARESYSRNHLVMLTVGVLLCTVCSIPSAIISNTLPSYDNLCAALLLIILAVGVLLIVNCSYTMKGYNTLLKLNGIDNFKVQYEPEDLKNYQYRSQAAEFWMSVYWPTMVCFYLIISFLTFRWELTWVIWPVAGVLYRPLNTLLREKN